MKTLEVKMPESLYNEVRSLVKMKIFNNESEKSVPTDLTGDGRKNPGKTGE